MCGLLDTEILCFRDPNIRPTYYYKDEELVVVASERPVIQTHLIVNQKIFMK